MVKYDPTNVSAYYGTCFITKYGSGYILFEDGTFTEEPIKEKVTGRLVDRPYPKGVEIEMITGVPPGYDLYKKIMMSFFTEHNPKAKRDLKKIVTKEGTEPVRGLRLLVCLTDEDTRQTGKNGILTPELAKIEIAKKK